MLTPRWINLPPKEPPPPPPPDFIPEGRYLLEVETVVEKESQWGNHYFQLRCKIIHPVVQEDFRVHFILSLALSALWRMRDFLEAVLCRGVEGEFYLEPDALVGSRFYADLTIGCFRGKRFNEVRNFYPANKSA